MDDFDNVQCQQIILTQYKLSDGERGGLIFDNKKTFSCLCTAFVLYLCTAAKTVIKVKQVLISKTTFCLILFTFPYSFSKKVRLRNTKHKYSVKGQCYEIFDFFFIKNSTWAPYEQAKRFREFFGCRKDIREKRVSTVSIVDYADTQFSNFVIEYLHKNEKVRKTVFACSNGD